MRPSSHDALEQAPYSQTSDTTHSVAKMVADRLNLCCLWVGHRKYMFIDVLHLNQTTTAGKYENLSLPSFCLEIYSQTGGNKLQLL